MSGQRASPLWQSCQPVGLVFAIFWLSHSSVNNKFWHPHCKLCLNLSMNDHKEIRGEKKHISKIKKNPPQISAIVTTYHSRPSLENRKEMGEGPLLKLLVKETTVKDHWDLCCPSSDGLFPRKKATDVSSTKHSEHSRVVQLWWIWSQKTKLHTGKTITVPAPTSRLPL